MPKTSQTPVKQGTTDIITIENGKRLSDYIEHLPYGKIDKSVPNIGATHMELTDQSRNSIIVFPTRSLAATKALDHNIHYIGSAFQDIKPSNSNKIRGDLKAGKRVKIAAVADSFIKLYEELKSELHSYMFFLMMDEIDSFQTESSYRPKLEECLDIYDNFPEDRRCLVSATLETFSNSKLTYEKLTQIVVANYEKPVLKVIYAPDSVLKVTSEKIVELFPSGHKLFIAFNSIEGILKVLQLLPESIRNESGILCSPQSYKKINPYPVSQISGGLLHQRVTFFTSAYFVGIDVKEPEETVHTLVATDTSLPTSLISVAKIRQILGRVRNKSLSQTLVLNLDPLRFTNTTGFETLLNNRQKAYEKVLNAINEEFGKLNLHVEAKAIKKAMLDSCAINNVELLRERNGDVVISNLNLDYLRIQNSAFKRLYVDIRNSIHALKLYFDVKQLTVHSSLSNEQKIRIKAVETELRDLKLRNALEVMRSHITDPRLVEGKFNETQTKIWLLAQPPIDVKKVEGKIKPIIEKGQVIKELNKVLFQVDVFSRDPLSDLWRYLNLHFDVGRSYCGAYIHEKLNEIARAMKGTGPFKEQKSKTESVRTFRKIYKCKPGKDSVTKEKVHVIQETHVSDYCV
ncbi:MAG: hypothetical protein JXR56_02950 [Candidatus Cloacimonetes bacterium]|nr:hypothetical protein [Candidatus Cloacimonadota bacterium]